LSRLASLLSSAILLILLLLFILTVLARMGVFSFLGAAVVYSGSMEPSINRWDLVVWTNKDYSRGDVVLCCLTRTFCYTHRYIDDCPGGTCIITKGDANPAPDPVPVSRDMVRGAVIAVVPRELWIPLFLFAVAVPLLSIARTPVIGLGFSLTILTVFFFVFTVYGLTQPPIQPTDIEPPILYLSRSYFDEGSCSFVISYTGNLGLTEAYGFVNNVSSTTLFNATHIIVHPPGELLADIYRGSGDAVIAVNATLNNIGRLSGSYVIKVFGEEPQIRPVNGSLVIYNPNCFPLSLNVSFQYAYRAGEAWRFTDNTTFTLMGRGEAVLSPPEGSAYAYADVYYYAHGAQRHQKVLLRYG
jgi:signal peptidase I